MFSAEHYFPCSALRFFIISFILVSLLIVLLLVVPPLAVGIGYVTAKCREAVSRRRNRRKDKNER